MISVLYVDDEADLLEVAHIFLEETGEFRVDTLTSAKMALDSPALQSYDAIISDYQMAEMDGITFLKAIRERFGDIPFILFTGRGREEVVIDAINNGADFYIQKGGDPEAQFAELSHKIRQAVSRKRAERALSDSDKRLADIINFLPDATFAIDRAGQVIAWNHAIEEMTGIAAADMLGKRDHEYAIPFYGARRPILIDLIFEPDNIIRERYTHIIHEKDILIADTTLPRPKGNPVTLLGKASPLYNQKGEIVGAIESIRDITEIKKTEQVLQRSEERFRNLIQNSSDMIRIIGRDGLIAYSSPSTLRITGYDPSGLIGKDPFEYVHPDDREHARKAFVEVQGDTNPHIPTEYRIRHAEGHFVDVEAVASNLLDVPEIDGIVITVRPITERKRAEETLRERERTLRINEERLVMAQDIGQTGSWEYSFATNTIWGSAEGLRIFGFPPKAGDFAIEDIEACIPERERVHQALIDLINTEKEYNLEYTINPADGSAPKVIHSVARLDKDPAGNPVRVTGVIQDITERSRVSEEISFKNVILSTQQETSPDAILIVDENGMILNYNRKFIDIWEIPEDLIASRLDDPVLQHVTDQLAEPEVFLSRVKYLYDHKDEKSYEELLLKDGRMLERFSAPMLGESGRYYGRVWYFRDITGRKKAEESLHRQILFMQKLIDTIPSPIFFKDRQGIYRGCNAAFEKFIGLPKEQIIGKTMYDIAPQRLADLFYESDKALFETLGTGTFESQLRSADGILHDVILNKATFSDEEEGTVILVGVIQDITERKRAEVALRQSEEKFRGMAERISDIVLLVDKDFNTTYVSPSLMAMMGKNYSDILGNPLPISNLLPPDQEKIRAAFLENKELKTTGPLEISFPVPGGARILEFHGVPIQNKGVFQGVQLVAHDITGIRNAQEELRENYDELHKNEQVLRISEEKFRALVEHSLDGILITDFSGILLFANHAAGLIVDMQDPEPLIGKANVLEFVDKELQADAIRDLNKISQGIDTHLMHYKLLTKTKREVWVECLGKKITFGESDVIFVSMRDVTERKRAEERLKESEKKFSTIFKNSPVALTLVSATDGTFIDVNDTFLKNTGYARHEVIGKMAAALEIFADRTEYKRFSSALQNQRRVYGWEIKCRIKSGEIRTCRFSSGIILMGKKPHILSTVEDITERKKTEDALRESESKLRRLTDNAPDMIFRMSISEGKYEYMSPASVALTGYTPEEFYANPGLVRKLIHPAWQEYFKRHYEALLNNEIPPTYEFQIIDRDGKTRWVNQRNMLVEDERGRPVALEGIVSDITQQKTIENELRRSELRSLAVSENAGSLIWECNAEGVYCYASPSVMQILGYRPDELVGKMHFYDLFDPSVRENLKKTVFAAFEEHEPFRNFENLNLHKNGAPVLLSTSGTPVFDEDGTFTGYCGVDEDITKRTATQSAIQAIVRSMVGTTGINSLHTIVETVSSWLGAECVMVGEIQPDRKQVKVLSMILDGNDVTDFTYTLTGTPCADVEKVGFCHYPDNAVQLFPDAKDIVELNIRGYVGTALKDSEGTVVGILCALSRSPIRPSPSIREIMDIIAVKAAAELERNQIERTLDKNLQLLAEAMDLAHLVNWEFDVASGMFTFDDRFYALYGTTAKREGGNLMPAETYAREFVHPDDRHMVGEEVERALKSTDPDYTARVEHRIIRRDKEIRHIVVSIRITKDAEGRTVKTHGANQDITEIRKAEEAVRESEGKFRSLVETSPGMIWETDTDGRFRYMSPISATMLGYTPKELIGRRITDLIPEQMAAVVRDMVAHFGSSSSEPISPFEVIARHRDGRDLVLEIRPSRITGPEGEVTGFRGVAYDTTERKRAEEALKLANRQLNLLGSITRHDLLNKITVILGNLRIAEKKCADPALAEHLAKIRSATEAIKSQIEFTRIYQKLGSHEPRWIALDAVLPHQYLPPTITLDAEVGGVIIHADPMLEKVFFNLLDNSVRHGQHVTRIQVSFFQSGGDLVIVWEDNGVGVPSEDKAQVFDRGFGSNTGLGMFLASEILSLTGITIRENGEPGRGARFEITVPMGAYRIAAEK